MAFVKDATLDMRINLPYTLMWLEKVQKHMNLAEWIKNLTTA